MDDPPPEATLRYRPIPALAATTLLVATFMASAPAHAAWPRSPFVNLAVAGGAAVQDQPGIAGDGSGGVLVVHRQNAGSDDILLHHVLSDGRRDPAWPAAGVPVCDLPSSQSTPVIVSDGAGGALLAWQDSRSGLIGVFVHHVKADGTLDPAWPAGGVEVSGAFGYEQFPTIVEDGAGGAIVAWFDRRSLSNWDIYAQRILANGTPDPAWPVNGVAVCTNTADQYLGSLIPDGAGGAILTWADYRPGATPDVYAQRVTAGGVAVWTPDGIPVCTAANDQSWPRAVSDGAGGALVAWHDLRSGTGYDLYAHHVLAGGVADPDWPAQGVPLSTATGTQSEPALVSDGFAGAYVVWRDRRSGTNDDLYAHHLLGNGMPDPAWAVNGTAVCTAAGDQFATAMSTDDAGGAVLVWQDRRGGANDDLYAHHLTPAGVDPAWTAQGIAISSASGMQSSPAIVGAGGDAAVIAWADARSAVSLDVYAQRIGRHGYLGTPEAEIRGCADVPNDQGGRVKLSWDASYLEGAPFELVTSYNVFRSAPPELVASALRHGRRIHGLTDARSFVPGDLLASSLAGATEYWEFLAVVNGLDVGQYSLLAPTAGDSTADGNPATAFMVQARTAGGQHWESYAASGYSVDDLPPSTPALLAGHYASGATHLSWPVNPEPDVAGYRLYRGATSDFAPAPANRIAAQADTGYSDAGSAGAFYKLSAVDVHGNESGFRLLAPTSTTAVGGGPAPASLALLPPSPNPARESCALRLALPRSGRASLSLFDAAGRRVRTLADAEFAAGLHRLDWDLRDARGTRVRAGLYFAELLGDGRRLTRRLVVTE